jgi:hypothetical protein
MDLTVTIVVGFGDFYYGVTSPGLYVTLHVHILP